MVATTMNTVTTVAAGILAVNAAAVDFTNGNQFLNPTGRAIMEIIHVGVAAPITVAFTTQGTYSVGSAVYNINDLNVSVTNATSKWCGPFDKALFNDANGMVQVSWSSATNVTARVIEMGTF
jgi:hypothetical protein